jgi:CHAD domain-containing protein
LRIRARAIRWAGELLKQFQNERARTDLADGAVIQTQMQAGHDAGMSERQISTASAVAKIPEK